MEHCRTVEELVDIFLQQILNGLVLGGIYAMVALGYTMVYGLLGVINFAHGDMLMVGALVSASVIEMVQRHRPELAPFWTFLVALGAASAVCGGLGYLIERFAYRPLRTAPKLNALITAIGLSVLLQTTAMLIWSPAPRIFPQLLSIEPIELHLQPNGQESVMITTLELAILAVALLTLVVLFTLVRYTRWGRALRAVAQNLETAQMLGINPNFSIASVFVVGSILAAWAGMMIGSEYGSVHFYMGFMPGMKGFIAAVLGGVGNLKGAFLGGLLLGLIEQLGAGYMADLTANVIGSQYQDAFAFVALILILMFRPTGLLGSRRAERV